jgi:hypothetical protein
MKSCDLLDLEELRTEEEIELRWTILNMNSL